MKNQVMEKVLQLTTRREKHLVVAAVRFLRTCIGRKVSVHALNECTSFAA